MAIWIWLILAGILALIEVLTQTMITVWFVIGALAAFVAAFLGAPEWLQILLFVALSIILLIALRPYALKHMKHGEANEASPVGMNAKVIQEINKDALTGRVETPDHMTWAAESENGDIIPVGAQVKVIGTRSITLIVERTEI